MIAVTIEVERPQEQLRRMSAALQDQWFARLRPEGEHVIERDVRSHFSAQEGPGGPWAPLAPLTLALSQGAAAAKVGTVTRTGMRGKSTVVYGKGGEQRSAVVRRTAGSRVLTDNGALLASLMGAGADGAFRQAGKDWFELGSQLPYAARQQFGGTWPVTRRQRGFLSGMLGSWFRGSKIRTPARPYLWLSRAGQTAFSRAAAATANRMLREALR